MHAEIISLIASYASGMKQKCFLAYWIELLSATMSHAKDLAEKLWSAMDKFALVMERANRHLVTMLFDVAWLVARYFFLLKKSHAAKRELATCAAEATFQHYVLRISLILSNVIAAYLLVTAIIRKG